MNIFLLYTLNNRNNGSCTVLLLPSAIVSTLLAEKQNANQINIMPLPYKKTCLII